MIRRIHQSLEEQEEGFTLIELLVVVIIIGILAAIAIPVFLNQREKAWDSAAKSDVRNMTTAQETYLTGENTYAEYVDDADDTDTDTLTDVGFSRSEGVAHGTCGDQSGYVVVARHTSSANYFYFDSATGQTVETDGTSDVGDSCTVDPSSLLAPDATDGP